MKPLKVSEICRIIGGSVDERFMDLEVTGVSADSRDDLKGKLFVAIKGERDNGHDFIASVFEKGAACALCDEERDFAGFPVIQTAHNVRALGILAENYLKSVNMIRIGITGSVGKTTVKDMCAAVLSAKYKTFKTPGNANTQIGLPLAVFLIDETFEAAVFELGMRNFGEIKELCEICHPGIGVITNIGESHIEFLGSKAGILQAKTELFAEIPKIGKRIINSDDQMLFSIKNKYENLVTCGTNSDNDFYATDVKYNGLISVEFKLHSCLGCADVLINAPGKHMVTNALCAAAAGEAAGLSLEEIKIGLALFKPSEMRLNITEEKGFTLLDDAYNASPLSMNAAFDVLSQAKGRKFCVLGDMFELGSETKHCHVALANTLKDYGFNGIFGVGEAIGFTINRLNELGIPAKKFESKQEAVVFIKSNMQTGDSILVKASRGMHFEEIVLELKK